ncbi:hypothetical protein ZHAS_00016497 [Anopheles sinensis]|uniref:Uncharacterized protein n=1 Tax=Anopheles sinensis TaxID=74873 RepID=A0A084WDT2_ANOSI|nr:hypothetical protein ZHAS_00016497 [Anopheles sinensis]
MTDEGSYKRYATRVRGCDCIDGRERNGHIFTARFSVSAAFPVGTGAFPTRLGISSTNAIVEYTDSGLRIFRNLFPAGGGAKE